MGNSFSPTRLELYQRLIEISRDLVSTLDLPELLNRIVHAAAELCQAEAASILLYNENNRELYFEAASNMDNQVLQGVIVPLENSIAGWVVTNHQHVIINDALHDERHYTAIANSLQMSVYSLIGIPLMAKGKVIGALEVINKKDQSFNEDDLDLINALGAQAAIAIENSRLFQQSDLIAELVHELRTPMASLDTAVHLLVRPDIDEKQRQYLTNMIRSEISRLSELTTAFLDLARLESGRIQFHTQAVHLDKVLTDCIEIMQPRVQERQLTLENQMSHQQLTVRADPDKVKEVAINLLSNAIKYNFPGGKIVIQSVVMDGYLGFSIEDNGPGIPNEGLKHLFEKFYRVPGSEKLAPGTGLGLSICRRIINAHQGKIDVESQVGRGTKFTVLLPKSG